MTDNIVSEKLTGDLSNTTINEPSPVEGDSKESTLSLLQELELLNYNERMHRMVEIGRDSISNSVTAQDLSNLRSGSLYERTLGLQALWGSGGLDVAISMLRHSTSTLLKRQAARFIIFNGDDQDALEALRLIPESWRRSGCLWLRKKKKVHIIDEYMKSLDPQGESFRKLLPTSSEEMVKKHLPGILDRVKSWRYFIRLHAQTTCEIVGSAMFIKETLSNLQWDQMVFIKQMKFADPKLAQSLVDMVMTSLSSLSGPSLSRLLSWRPREVAQHFIDQKDPNPSWIIPDPHFAKLSLEQIIALFKIFPNNVSKSSIRLLSPELRRTVWEIFRSDWQRPDGTLRSVVVEALPADLRFEEARRQIALESVNLDPETKQKWIKLLPWDEATIHFDPFIHNNETKIRKTAIKHRIDSALYQPDRYKDVINLVIQHRFEQEPFLQVMFSSLIGLPAKHWKQEHLAGLAQIVRNMLDTVKLSHRSISLLRKFVIQLIPFHTSWAVEQMLLVSEEYGGCPFIEDDLFYGLQPFQEWDEPPSPKNGRAYGRQLLPTFLPRMMRLKEQKAERDLMNLLCCFQFELGSSEELLHLLEELIITTTDKLLATKAIYILNRHMRTRLEVLIRIWLEKDADFFGTVTPVIKYMQSTKQSLLLPYMIADAETSGRDHGDSIALRLTHCGRYFYRWTQKQQHELSEILLEYLHNSERTTAELRLCIKTLALLSYIDVRHIISLSNDKRPQLRDFALQRLAHLDGEEGFPPLMAALGDERSRVAIYSLRSYILQQPKSQALKLLHNFSAKRATVAKGVIRLIADLKTDEAFGYLLNIYETDLHDDVRIALLRRLSLYKEKPEVLKVLIKALQNPKTPVALAGAAAIFSFDPKTNGIAEVLQAVLTHAEFDVREFGFRYMESSFVDSQHQLLDLLLKMVKENLEGSLYDVTRAIFRLYGQEHPEIAAKTFEIHLNDMQNLKEVFSAYCSSSNNTHNSTRKIMEVLRRDRVTLSLRLKLAFRQYSWEDLREEISTLVHEIHSDALVLLQNLIPHLASRYGTTMEEVEREWGNHENEKLRRLGLAVLKYRSSIKPGWTDELRKRLKEYQQDESLLVAEAATFIFPSNYVSGRRQNPRCHC